MKNPIQLSKNYFRRKRSWLYLLAMIIGGMLSTAANAQLYTRTTFNSAYVPISTGAGATVSTATGDDVNQTAIPLGFTLNYAGVNYTSVGLNTNGLLWFDAVAPSAGDGAFISRMYATGGTNQSISAWWTDAADDASSEILYQTQGTPGSQTFTVQYTNYPHYRAAVGTNIRLNYQVIFYEGTNVIEFHYGSRVVTGPPTNDGGACIAIEYGAGGPGNFIDLVTGSNSTAHGMLSPLLAWPSYNYRLTPGAPTPVPAGTYNVGIGQTYASLTLATSDLNHRGISGPVTLNLTDANYDTTVANGSHIFPIFVGPVVGTSAVNTLTISKIGTPATFSYRGSPVVQGNFGYGSTGGLGGPGDGEEPIMGVCSRYTTISNINLVSLGTTANDVEVGLMVFEAYGGSTGAWNNVFDKISVTMDRSNVNTIGIHSNNLTAPGGIQGTNSFNTYQDITIRDCYVGIDLTGVTSATGPPDVGNQIITSSCTTFNSIGDPNVIGDLGGGSSNAYGIRMHGQENFVVRNNVVSNVSSTGNVSDANGIFISSVIGICELSNNSVRGVTKINVTSQFPAYGIRVSSNGNEIKELRAFNNSVSDIKSTYSGAPTSARKAIGMAVVGSGNSGKQKMYFWNNSISMDGSSFLNGSNTCFEISDASDVEHVLKNNVFANFTPAQTGVASHYAFVTSNVDRIGYSVLSQSDHNDLYIANDQGTSGHVGLGATTNYSTLAAWQAAITAQAGTDANSISSDPFFLNNNNDLHATALSAALNGAGTTPPAYITTDFDCQTRNSPHDIGFDDFGICTPVAGTITPGSATFCAGSTYFMEATGFSTEPGTAYQWMVSTVSGGPYTNVANGGTSTSYTTDALTAGTYYFVMQTSCSGPGTDITNELVLTVLPLPEPVITPSGATTFCEGGSVNLDAGIFTAYIWSNSSSNQSISVTQSGSYSVTVSDANGCIATSASVVVTVNPLPSVSLDPFANVCSNDAEFALSGGSPSGGVYSGTGVNAGNFNPATAGIGTHIITYTFNDLNGCSNSATSTIEVTDCGCIPPAAITAINGQFGVCQGQPSVTFSVAPDPNATSYVWTLPNGLTGTSTTNSITVSVSATYTNANICVVASNLCGQTQQFCRLVSRYTVKPAKPATISGSPSACVGSTQIYSVPQSNNVISYAWTVPVGSVILSGQGTNSVEVQFGNVLQGAYVGVSASNCIGTSAVRTFSVYGLPKTPNEAVGVFPKSGVCANNTYNYAVIPVASADEYTWTAPAGAVIFDGVLNGNPLTTTSANVQITFPSGFVSGTVEVFASNVCGSSGLRSAFVKAFTNTPNNISGPRFAMCGTTAQVYSITPVVGATSYNWTVPGGAAIVGASNGNAISVDFAPNFSQGSICVAAVNACGNSIERCLVVQGRPGPPNPITGPLAVCKNGGNYNYSVLPFPGATTYVWQGSTGVIVSGNTENVALNFLNVNSPSATISARALNACGKSEKSLLDVQVDNCRFAGVSIVDDLIVFPNPASESVTVSFSLAQSLNTMIKIADLNGKLVIVENYSGTAGFNKKAIDIANVAPGTYILSVTNDLIHNQFKIVIQ